MYSSVCVLVTHLGNSPAANWHCRYMPPHCSELSEGEGEEKGKQNEWKRGREKAVNLNGRRHNWPVKSGSSESRSNSEQSEPVAVVQAGKLHCAGEQLQQPKKNCTCTSLLLLLILLLLACSHHRAAIMTRYTAWMLMNCRPVKFQKGRQANASTWLVPETPVSQRLIVRFSLRHRKTETVLRVASLHFLANRAEKMLIKCDWTDTHSICTMTRTRNLSSLA